jgi:hypothetical protein
MIRMPVQGGPRAPPACGGTGERQPADPQIPAARNAMRDGAARYLAATPAQAAENARVASPGPASAPSGATPEPRKPMKIGQGLLERAKLAAQCWMMAADALHRFNPLGPAPLPQACCRRWAKKHPTLRFSRYLCSMPKGGPQLSEDLAARQLAGEAIDVDQTVRICNSARRAIADLRIADTKRAKPTPGAAFHEHAAAVVRRREAAEVQP